MADDPKPGKTPEADDEVEVDDEPAPDAELEPDGDEEIDDGAEPPADDEQEPEPGAEPDRGAVRERQPGRAAQTIRKLRRDLQLERMAKTPNPGQDPQARQQAYEQDEARKLAAAQERERLGEAGVVAQYWAERGVREARAVTQGSQNQQFEREDSRDFRILCREDNVKPEMQDYVEDIIATARQNGNFMLTREAVLNHRLGQLARERLRNGNSRQQQRADGQRRRQHVPAPRGGSDTPATRTRKVKSSDDLDVDDFEKQFGNRVIGR